MTSRHEILVEYPGRTPDHEIIYVYCASGLNPNDREKIKAAFIDRIDAHKKMIEQDQTECNEWEKLTTVVKFTNGQLKDINEALKKRRNRMETMKRTADAVQEYLNVLMQSWDLCQHEHDAEEKYPTLSDEEYAQWLTKELQTEEEHLVSTDALMAAALAKEFQTEEHLVSTDALVAASLAKEFQTEKERPCVY